MLEETGRPLHPVRQPAQSGIHVDEIAGLCSHLPISMEFLIGNFSYFFLSFGFLCCLFFFLFGCCGVAFFYPSLSSGIMGEKDYSHQPKEK